MKVLQTTKPIDKEKERSERMRSLSDFLASYNRNIPKSFPRASSASLKTFQKSHPSLFSGTGDTWSLDRHRKRVMDWLPQHLK